jgi:hypothetical protein
MVFEFQKLLSGFSVRFTGKGNFWKQNRLLEFCQLANLLNCELVVFVNLSTCEI